MSNTALEYFNTDLIASYRELSAEVAALKEQLQTQELSYQQRLKEQNDDHQDKLEKQQDLTNFYKHRYQLLQRELFGKKSERRELARDENQQLLPGFSFEDLFGGPLPEAPTEHINYTRKKRKSQGTRGSRHSRFPAWIRREVEVLTPQSTQCPCCSQEMQRADKPQVTEKLCCSRDPFYVKEYHRHLYTCQSCKQAATKPPVPEVFERSLFDHTAVGFFLVNKFSFSLPHFRQAKMLHQLGIKVSDDQITNISNQALSLLLPIYAALETSVISSEVLIADDTRLQAATGKKKKKLPAYKRGCLWGMVGEQQEVLYAFSPARTHSACTTVLENFSGYLVVDGYDGFEKVALRDDVTIVHCNNHARRKFVEAEKSDKKRAHEALAFYQALYKIEETAAGLSPPQKQRYREQHAQPVLDSFRQWLNAVALEVTPKTPLAKAVNYVHKRWQSLTAYLKNPNLPFDTMQVERAFRIVAVGRKNFLHAASENGAQMAAVAFSLIESCKMVDVDPFIYLCDVLERVGSHPAKEVSTLTPRLWKKHFLDAATQRYQSP